MKTIIYISAVALAACLFFAGFFLGQRKKSEEWTIHLNPNVPIDLEPKDEHGLHDGAIAEMDPISRKHLILSIWYAHQASAATILELDTEHKFEPIWMGRNPLDVLNEQTNFMEGYLRALHRQEKEAGMFEDGHRWKN